VNFKLLTVYMSPNIPKKTKTVIFNDDPTAVTNAVNGVFDEGALFSQFPGIFWLMIVVGEEFEIYET